MKKWKLAYSVLFFGVCLTPLVGMGLTKEEASSENRTLSAFPALKTEEGLNVNWLSDAGDYFQDHFAFRNELVTANALVNGKIFQVSTASGVIQGTGGWLYYKDSLDDYLGINQLSDRGLFNVAHTLSMMQKNLTARGKKFLFTVAPNKNSLYGEHMPYYDSLKVAEVNNLARLTPILEKEGVNYTDLKSLFEAQGEVLYHERDSHWNNKGAALAADAIMTDLVKMHDSYKDEAYEVRTDHIGDLDKMLYPKALTPEDEVYYDKTTTFAYVGEVESNFDPKITTVNPVKEGSLVMYRDSFGNTLLPFFADAYANAYFSRGVPYQLSDVDTQNADTVVVERAERFLPEMAKNPPVLEGSLTLLDKEEDEVAADGAENLTMRRQGLFFQITGKIDPQYLDWDSKIYLRINGQMVYEAFPRNEEGSDTAFTLYLSTDKLSGAGDRVEILTDRGETLEKIYDNEITEEITQ